MFKATSQTSYIAALGSSKFLRYVSKFRLGDATSRRHRIQRMSATGLKRNSPVSTRRQTRQSHQKQCPWRVKETNVTKPSKAEIIDLVSKRSKNRIKGSARLEMPGTTTLYVDETGAIESDQTADITLTADASVFYDIAMGAKKPAKAFMMRQLKVDGNPMKALKIGEILSTTD